MSQFAAPAEWRQHHSAMWSPLRFHGRRAILVFVSLAFAAAFCWNYMQFQVVALSWLNVYYTPTPLPAWIAAFLVFLVPGLFVPTELVRPSSITVLMQYTLVLMPVCFVPIFRQEMPLEHCILLAGSFSVALLVILSLNKAPRRVLPIPRMRPDVAWSVFILLYGVLNLIVVLTGPRWQLVNFANVYDVVRQEALAYSGSMYAYAYMNLAWAINPFLLAYAMSRQKYWLAAGATLMEVYLYGYGGFKSMVFVPLAVIGIHFLVRSFRQPASKFIFVLLVLILGSSGMYIRWPSSLTFAVDSLYNNRTLGMAGQNAAGYDYFAYNHGFTYWSHLKGVNWFIHYNFKEDLGNEVGLMEQGYATQANTGFLATDGVSAMGFSGVIIIAFVVGAYLWLIDCAASGHDSAFAVSAFSGVAFMLTNAGFFTSLLTFGGLFILLLLQFMPLVREGDHISDPAAEDLPTATLRQGNFV